MPKISEATFTSRRARIMHAARTCFARHGIRVSVDEICAEAGVSKGALYGYFASKDAIIQAIADEHSADVGAVAAAATPAELITLLLARSRGGDPESCRLEVEAWTYSLNNAALSARLLTNASDLKGAIEQALRAMAAAGTIRVALPFGEAAAVLETFAIGIVARGAMGGGLTKPEARARFGALMQALTAPG